MGDDVDLVEEPVCAEESGELGAEYLDRDIAMMLAIAREIDRRHPAAPQLPLDDVAVGEGRFESVQGRCVHERP